MTREVRIGSQISVLCTYPVYYSPAQPCCGCVVDGEEVALWEGNHGL